MKGIFHIGLIIWSIFPLSKVHAADKRSVDSVLDRLEQRLMDQDRESLSFGAEPSKSKQSERARTVYDYAPRDISPRRGDEDQLVEIGGALGALQADIDSYAGEVQRLKQKILEDAAIDTFVTITGQLESPDAMTIRTLRLSLDGYTVYTIDEVSGLWLPRPTIPFFSGPLAPGDHKLAFEARIGRRNANGVPVADDTFQVINQVFDLKVADGKTKKSWVITMKAPDKENAKGVAEFGEKAIE